MDSQTWRLERSTPVRADAEAIFVPIDELPNAALGDSVVVTGTDDDRTGSIVDRTDRDGEPYFRIEFR